MIGLHRHSGARTTLAKVLTPKLRRGLTPGTYRLRFHAVSKGIPSPPQDLWIRVK